MTTIVVMTLLKRTTTVTMNVVMKVTLVATNYFLTIERILAIWQIVSLSSYVSLVRDAFTVITKAIHAAESGSPNDALRVTRSEETIRPIDVSIRLQEVFLLPLTLAPLNSSLTYECMDLGARPMRKPVASPVYSITSSVISDELNTLLFLLRPVRPTLAPAIPRVPPDAVREMITTIFVVNRKTNGASVLLPSIFTTRVEGLLVLVPP